MKRELILNTRYGEFKLGASIDEYKQMPHHMDIYEEESGSVVKPSCIPSLSCT